MSRQRTVRLVLAAVALYELRSLVASVGSALQAAGTVDIGSATLWLAALFALALGAGLWQTGRGLGHVARPPRWGLRLAGLSLMLGSALVVIGSTLGSLVGHGTVAQLLGSGASWLDAPPALLFGLLLAISIEGAGWLARRRLGVPLAPRFAPVVGARAWGRSPRRSTAAPPLLAGWSDRGPPRLA